MRSLRHRASLPILVAAVAGSSLTGCSDAEVVRGRAPHPPPPLLALGSEALCLRAAAGRASVDDPAVSLSRLHAVRRFFGVHGRYHDIDERFVAALHEPEALGADLSAALATYAGDDDAACASYAAFHTTLGAAAVTVVGGIALIRPGTGAVMIPANVGALAIDLRGLPNVPELRGALGRAVRPALAGDPRWLTRAVRHHRGMTDEVISEGNVYHNEVVDVPGEPLAGGETVDALASLPIALITDARMPPAAAELAMMLRLDGRAWLFGADVFAAVAEARWYAVANRGVLLRVSDLSLRGARIPDVLQADDAGADPNALLATLPARGDPPRATWGAALRRRMVAMTPFGDGHPARATLGDARAALIAAHGAARSFFPYFDLVGDHIDGRLMETLATLDGASLDRHVIRDLLRRLGAALSDGNASVLDREGTIDPDGVVPVVVEHIDGEPVVRRSLEPSLLPGDTIVAIDGVAMSDFYADALASTSAASDGYRLGVAARRWRLVGHPVTMTLRNADGVLHDAVIAPAPMVALDALGFAPSKRVAGWLEDLAAPSLYYINLSQDVMVQPEAFRAALLDAAPASGLVLDMRGYPAAYNQLEYIARLVQEAASSPQIRLLRVDITRVAESELIYYAIAPAGEPAYHGPVALLVGNNTVAAAENISLMLVDAERVTVVGRPTAATNGNITGVQLPGGFGFTFTGMDVRHADGSPFHAVGIAPAVEVELTAEAFSDGVDPELMAAIDVLTPAP